MSAEFERAGGAASRRERILRRDRFRCVYCGETFPAERLTLDHVQPRMRGGDSSDGNVVTACVPCNTLKGGRAAWEYLRENEPARQNFMRYATSVWPRLLRAIEEAVRRS